MHVMRGLPAIGLHALLGTALFLPGCEKGPAEKAGENVDNTVDQATEGHTNPLEKGPAQKAGENVDDATKSNP